MVEKRLRIPNEDVRLSLEEVAVTQTEVFQRLFWLKQLGLAFLVYPNATHTRGAHSIRCLAEAQRILNSIGGGPSEEERRAVRMAALLHDIGHLPFSHTLEDEHVILRKHDRPERLERTLNRLKGELASEEARKLVDAATPIVRAISDKKAKGCNRRCAPPRTTQLAYCDA
jgi:HD superfamily phosphohydrolase